MKLNRRKRHQEEEKATAVKVEDPEEYDVPSKDEQMAEVKKE